MPIVFTRPAEQAFSTIFKARIADVYSFFPELSLDKIICGMIKTRGPLQGVAINWTKPAIFRLRPGASTFTIAHELTHLLQGCTFGVPHGETACDIWTIDRMPLEYLDSQPSYLFGSFNTSWKTDKQAIKSLCREAIERRKSMRNYIHWLRCRIREL